MNKPNPKTKKLNWYRRWKAFPYHSHVHWLALIFFAWIAGLAVLGSFSGSEKESREIAQAQVLGVRYHGIRAPETAKPVPEIAGEVMGEEIRPTLLPSDIEKQGIQPARNMNQHLKK
ncbi:MAG: hypothetical protein PHI73_02575 [Patescibacteria group bacterium]|nr:hypothetical protein [Patescibacteria group bacterium]